MGSEGTRLVWRGKGPSKITHPTIQRLLAQDRRVYLFCRDGDRKPFIFFGLATSVAAFDEQPVRVIWEARDPAELAAQTTPRSGGGRAEKQVRLPASELRRVTAEHLWNALNKLRDPDFQHVYGPSTEFDVVTDIGERFPPKAVFGLAATEALGFDVLPGHFSSGRGHVAFEILEDFGLVVIGKDDAAPMVSLAADEDRTWGEGEPKFAGHLRRERASGISKAKKAQFKRMHGRLKCEACSLDPMEHFGGPEGEACIEVHHHVVQVSEMTPGHQTKLDDLVCLCANCHRVEHRRMKDRLRSETRSAHAAVSQANS